MQQFRNSFLKYWNPASCVINFEIASIVYRTICCIVGRQAWLNIISIISRRYKHFVQEAIWGIRFAITPKDDSMSGEHMTILYIQGPYGCR